MEIINKKNLISFGIIIIFIVSLFYILQKPNTNTIKYVRIAGQEIKVELALTEREHSRGLSGRASLANDAGMLFVFAQPGKYSFWMKEMNFPIDIIWLSEDLKVMYIKKDARPESYPESYAPDYAPEQSSKYVLEVVSGFSDKNNLKVGESVEFVY